VQGSVGVGYNTDFWITSRTVNGADNLTFAYDGDGLPTATGGLGIKRNAQHGLVERDSVGTVKSAWSYTSRAALAGYNAMSGAAPLFQTSYVRDSLDRIVQLTETLLDTVRVLAFTYDSAGRLKEVQRDGAVTATYEYDQNGNRLHLTNAGGTVAATYDVQDRLTTYGARSYTYGSNGDLRTETDVSGTTTYSYDALGNLTAVTLPDATQITYVIDGRNRRVGKRVNGVMVQALLYEGQLRPVAELDGNQQVVSRFVYGTRTNVPDYMTKSEVTYRLIADHLGSVRLVVNTSDGAIAQRIDYDESGRVTLNTAPGFQPFGFAGGLMDDHTGFVRFGARDYDPVTGRWTIKEPLGFSAGVSNLYEYALGDPINFVDPTGLDSEYCEHLRKEINALRNEIAERYQVQRADPRDLFNTRRTGEDSWDGHNEQIENKQTRLQNKLKEWQNSPCNGSGGLPEDAWKWATVPVPTQPEPKGLPAQFGMPDFGVDWSQFPSLTTPQKVGILLPVVIRILIRIVVRA
jgi:RHS repeat-associated protein